MVRDKIIAELEFILTNGDQKYIKTIRMIHEYFLSKMAPKNLDGGSKDNVSVLFQVEFSELSIALMTNGIPDAETLTVFKFYSAMKYFEERKPKK